MEWRGTFYLIGMEVSQGFSNLISNNLQQTNLYLHSIAQKVLIVNKRLVLFCFLQGQTVIQNTKMGKL